MQLFYAFIYGLYFLCFYLEILHQFDLIFCILMIYYLVT